MTFMIILKRGWNLRNAYLPITSDFLFLPLKFLIVLLISIYETMLLTEVMFIWA
jgi:hypothetical protein